MAHREFTGSNGTRWQAWDVIPYAGERRGQSGLQTDARPLVERRTKHEPRVHIEEGFEHGWLAFETAGEKRRLHPIPVGWQECTDVELIALCEAAERVTWSGVRPPSDADG